MSDFLAMGGYGVYVWASYAVFFVLLAIDFIAPRLRRRRVLAELRGRLRRQQRKTQENPSP
ncbi:heme exporter protein CcmD [Dokdonella sp.]|uniref:heme exporter protein CcmD n=1 Tax=Dokdonella sp. TaxID=2291710 RepID=UPI0025C0399A|nr:heme exporter protein CcmD [Dokdonella sp.]MBX3692531.1 heme exporter protein CcmD [Dokdonella sp.]MCW5569091.1 heme exporter protein CcmD [Dokdonella sp.]